MLNRIAIILSMPFFILLLRADHAFAEPDRIALILGNSAYQLTSPLKNPVNDAAAIATSLERLGFAVTRGLDLTLADMDSKVSEFAHHLGSSKVVFFYYAGHGMQLDGRNYLVPVDFNPNGREALTTKLVSMDKILDDITGGQRINIVILDACRDNPLANAFSTDARGGRSTSISDERGIHVIGTGLAEIKGNVGTLIAYATQPGNVASDGKGNHSPFADGLLKFIESPGLEIRDLLTQVRKYVIQETKSKQIPWDHSSLVERFYLKQNQLRAAPPP